MRNLTGYSLPIASLQVTWGELFFYSTIPFSDFCLNIPLEPDFPSTTIRLDHFLQKSGLVATGGQAKLLIQGAEILVNGTVETRRRRKLLPGDRVQYGPRTVQVTSDS